MRDYFAKGYCEIVSWDQLLDEASTGVGKTIVSVDGQIWIIKNWYDIWKSSNLFYGPIQRWDLIHALVWAKPHFNKCIITFLKESSV